MFMNSMRTQGFSLIELVVTVMVIGILVLVAYPAYQSYVIKARRSEAKVGLTELAQYQEDYYTDLNQYASTFDQLFGPDESDVNQYGFTYTAHKGDCENCETNQPIYSKNENEGFYAFEIRPDTGNTTSNASYRLVARPVGIQATGEADLDHCYAFYLDSRGEKKARKKGAQLAQDCW